MLLIRTIICRLCFVLINSVLLNLLYVWILPLGRQKLVHWDLLYITASLVCVSSCPFLLWSRITPCLWILWGSGVRWLCMCLSDCVCACTCLFVHTCLSVWNLWGARQVVNCICVMARVMILEEFCSSYISSFFFLFFFFKYLSILLL